MKFHFTTLVDQSDAIQGAELQQTGLGRFRGKNIMILCPKCRIQFSSSCLRCPTCNAFETPLAERQKYLRDRAIERVYEGENPHSVREKLISGGFVDFEADQVVWMAQKQLRSENRWYGFIRLIVGGVLLIGGLFLFAISIEAIRIQVNLGEASVHLLLGGIAAVLFGGYACVSGFYAVVTGRGSAIAPPKFH